MKYLICLLLVISTACIANEPLRENWTLEVSEENVRLNPKKVNQSFLSIQPELSTLNKVAQIRWLIVATESSVILQDHIQRDEYTSILYNKYWSAMTIKQRVKVLTFLSYLTANYSDPTLSIRISECLVKVVKEPKKRAIALIVLAIAHTNNHEYETALIKFKSVYPLVSKLKDRPLMSMVKNNIAITSLYLDKYHVAADLLKEAFVINKRGNYGDYQLNIANLMYAYTMLDDWQTWEKYEINYLNGRKKHKAVASDLIYEWMKLYKNFKQKGKSPTANEIEQLTQPLRTKSFFPFTYDFVGKIATRMDIKLELKRPPLHINQTELIEDPLINLFTCNLNDYKTVVSISKSNVEPKAVDANITQL